MNAGTANDTEDDGEIVGALRRVADVLPAPDKLVLRDDRVKVTLALSRRSNEFFKREAAKQQLPYQHDPGPGRRVHAAGGVNWHAGRMLKREVSAFCRHG